MLKLLAFSTVLLIGVRSAEVSLIFDSTKIVVNPGDPLYLDCGVRGEMRSCIWGNENKEIFQVEDVYNDLYDGYRKPENTNGNECGIIVNSVNTQHHGEWTCTVFVPGNSLVGSKQVVVTIKPTSPILEIDNRDRFDVTSMEDKSVVCSVAAARPAVEMKWYLGDKDITTMSAKEETLTDNMDIYKSVSTLTRKFMPDDNGKNLVCSINHKTLLDPDNASVPVSVVFKPIEKKVTTYYQIQPGNDYEVKFNFSANPKPYMMVWKYGENLESPEGSINIPAIEGRYASDIEVLGNDMYTAKLTIQGFSEEDSNKNYYLVVENEIGQTQYLIKLSVHDAPIDALSGGAIAGIIIVLLVVVVAIVAAGYARYRQMFCFAPIDSPDLEAKDIREEHDTESARGPAAAHPVTLKDRLGQFTKVFKKAKTDQDVKMDDVEKKALTKDMVNKETANKEHNPEEKETNRLYK